MATFIGLSVLLILTPGPNQALLTSRVLAGGMRLGWPTIGGLCTGMTIHVLAALVGVSALIAASASVFGVLKVLGGVYLVFLGVSALVRAGRSPEDAPPPARSRQAAWRDGALSMTLNPKAAVFFVAVVPGFAAHGPGFSLRVAGLLLIYAALTVVFWIGFALTVHRAQSVVRRPRVRAALERVTGVALCALGVRLATDC